MTKTLPEPRWEMWSPEVQRRDRRGRWSARIAGAVILGVALTTWGLVLLVVFSLI